MTIDDIIKDIENIYPCKVLYAISTGSVNLGNSNRESDIDYRLFTDDARGSKRYDDENIDVWVTNMGQIKETYPFFQVSNLDGIDHIVYCCNNEISAYYSNNRDELLYEFATVVFNMLASNVLELKKLGESTYESDVRYYGSMMRDAVLSTYMLTNYMQERPISDLTAEQKQILRDIRGKDGKRYTYQECLDILNSNYIDELVAHYSSYYPGKKHTRELFKILNRASKEE